ncbi:MAG: hypothetical protein FWC46_03385 [Actinomycetia bacterium]|nr:hypothetical protein [Actinomycetes bacterium]
MSALPISLPAPAAPGPVRLQRITNQPHRLARIPFLIMLSVMLLGGMVGVLVLTTMIQSQAQALRTYQTRATALGNEQAALAVEVAQLRSPTHLIQAASAIGLRPNPAPGVLSLVDGTVSGVPAPVPADALPNQVWSGPVTRTSPPPIKLMPVPGAVAASAPVADGGAVAADQPAPAEPATTDQPAAAPSVDATAPAEPAGDQPVPPADGTDAAAADAGAQP